MAAAGHTHRYRGGGSDGGGAVNVQHAIRGMPVVGSDGSARPHRVRVGIGKCKVL
jgi:hypothetical protein